MLRKQGVPEDSFRLSGVQTVDIWGLYRFLCMMVVNVMEGICMIRGCSHDLHMLHKGIHKNHKPLKVDPEKIKACVGTVPTIRDRKKYEERRDF